MRSPRSRRFEYVAREKLEKNDEGERPEDHERKPILRVVLDHDLSVFRLDQAFLAFERRGVSSPLGAFFFFLLVKFPRPQTAAVMLALKRGMTGFASAYFSTCSASYSACDQPAPALGSLCKGTATLRKASRFAEQFAVAIGLPVVEVAQNERRTRDRQRLVDRAGKRRAGIDDVHGSEPQPFVDLGSRCPIGRPGTPRFHNGRWCAS